MSTRFKFSSEKPPFLVRKRNIVLYASLGVGYFIYRKLLFYTLLNNNLLMDRKQTTDLETRNFILQNGKVIQGHPVNIEPVKAKKGQRILVIGAGITGIRQTRKLLENGYDVVLVDHNSELLLSKINKFLPEQSSASVSVWEVIKNFFYVNGKFTFNTQLMFDRYLFNWMVNALYFQIVGQTKIDSSFPNEKLTDQLILLDDRKQQILKELDNKKIDYKVIKGSDISQDVTNEVEGALRQTSSQCVNLEQELDKCGSINPVHFSQLYGCSVSRFIFDTKSQLVGVQTNQGIIQFHQLVICAGYQSKQLISLLGSRVPIIAQKKRLLKLPKQKGLMNQLSLVSGDKISFPLQNGVAVYQSLGFYDQSVEDVSETFIDQFISGFQKVFRDPINTESFAYSTYLDAVTPDGLPIVNKIPGFSNAFVNAGHSSNLQDASSQLVINLMESEVQSQLSFERFYLV